MKQCRKNKSCLYSLFGKICLTCKATKRSNTLRESKKKEKDVQSLINKTMHNCKKPYRVQKQKINLYTTTYLSPTNFVAREGKSAYINPAFHQKISRIVCLLADGKITISDYLHNVLQQHFETHREEILAMYHDTKKPIL